VKYVYVEILWQLQPLYIDVSKTFIMFAFSIVYWLQGNPRRWH